MYTKNYRGCLGECLQLGGIFKFNYQRFLFNCTRYHFQEISLSAMEPVLSYTKVTGLGPLGGEHVHQWCPLDPPMYVLASGLRIDLRFQPELVFFPHRLPL